MKLVYCYNWSSEEASGVDTIPFEFSSIEDFQLMVLNKIEEYKNKCIKAHGKNDGLMWYQHGYIELFNKSISVQNLEDGIMYDVYTLEDWFEKHANIPI